MNAHKSVESLSKLRFISMAAVKTIRDALARLMPSLTLSDATIEAKIVDVVGSYADSEAVERQNTLNVINNALANQKITSIEYYRRKAVEFQLGDNLIYNPINQGGYYENVDPEKRIVKQAYIVGSYPVFSLLVNKIGNDGHLTVLSPDELASFKTYFSAFQPLGLSLGIGSLSPATIYDNSLIAYTRVGVDATEVANAINDAFTNNESILRNTNIVSLTEISDIMQSVDGVTAVSFGNIYAHETGLDGVERDLTPENGLFKLTAGAFRFGTEVTPSMIKTLQ